MSNTSYWLYQKYFKIGSQDWLPCYPVEYAISGDTGQNPVVKQQDDPNCGYCTPEYRWQAASIDDAYICSAGTKYYKEYYQVSTDCAFHWSNVTPEQTRIGDIYESGSTDCIEYRWVDMDVSTNYICDECPEPQYRWTATTGYVCSGTNKMTKEIKQFSYDSATWQNVVPEESRAALPMIQSASTDCGFVPPTPTGYSSQYLTFVPTTGSSTFKFSGNTVQYSLDSGNSWTSLSSNTNSPTVNAGDKIMWKATGLTPTSGSGIGTFSSTNQFTVEGNIMSLYYGDDFQGQTDLTGKDYAFKSLFADCTKLTSAENLVLPATTLATNCYRSMFEYCTRLTTAPSLPATALASNCYNQMFYKCTRLTTAPSLSATTLAYQCYYGMFFSCTSLTTAPELPATTLGVQCYQYMFADCSGLTTAPALSATTLASGCCKYMFDSCSSLTTVPSNMLPATILIDSCYWAMFQNCSGLTTAPVLPATTLANHCYQLMFFGCTSLTTAPELPATTLGVQCYQSMFKNCTSLTTAPELSAATLVMSCYDEMFRNCTSLNSITCLATSISGWGTSNWVNGVAASGTFKKLSSMTSWSTGDNGIPSGWTVTNYSS